MMAAGGHRFARRGPVPMTWLTADSTNEVGRVSRSHGRLARCRPPCTKRRYHAKDQARLDPCQCRARNSRTTSPTLSTDTPTPVGPNSKRSPPPGGAPTDTSPRGSTPPNPSGLCRIQYLGDPDDWGFALYQASTETYIDSQLPNGADTGTPKRALDTALGLYLNDPTAWQLEPPKD